MSEQACKHGLVVGWCSMCDLEAEKAALEAKVDGLTDLLSAAGVAAWIIEDVAGPTKKSGTLIVNKEMMKTINEQSDRFKEELEVASPKAFLMDRARDIVATQADNKALWFGSDINQVRAALRQLHIVIEGGLDNPLIDIIREADLHATMQDDTLKGDS